jgi:hypothetical protein
MEHAVVAGETTPLLRRDDEERKDEAPWPTGQKHDADVAIGASGASDGDGNGVKQDGGDGSNKKQRSGWSSIIIVGFLFTVGIVFETLILVPVAFVTGTAFDTESVAWWALIAVLHVPYFVILLYLLAGLVERVGYMFLDCGCTPDMRNVELHEAIGYPTVCVQLAMFNEHEVSERIIQAAANIEWPPDKLEIQVLDDSTDPVCRDIVDTCIAHCRDTHPHLTITLQRRERRTGFKAGALEEGRKKTQAMFLALFDADFVPTSDFLVRAVPLFYTERVGDGGNNASSTWATDEKLALVQAQWGHLNAFDSPLTMSQSMWIDDHHSVQMMWRSRVWCVLRSLDLLTFLPFCSRVLAHFIFPGPFAGISSTSPVPPVSGARRRSRPRAAGSTHPSWKTASCRSACCSPGTAPPSTRPTCSRPSCRTP